jgi:uncharacterized protein affecting Mg2+/Co2+ transport
MPLICGIWKGQDIFYFMMRSEKQFKTRQGKDFKTFGKKLGKIGICTAFALTVALPFPRAAVNVYAETTPSDTSAGFSKLMSDTLTFALNQTYVDENEKVLVGQSQKESDEEIIKAFDTGISEDLSKVHAAVLDESAEDLTDRQNWQNEVYTVLDEQIVPNWEEGCLSWKFTYMDWHLVTDKTTAQYWVLWDENAWTDEWTGIRMVGSRYCVAIGQGYGYRSGDLIDVVMTNGAVIPCIIGDMKATDDCDSTERYQKYDGSVVELIIDSDYFTSPDQYPECFDGTVESIRLIKSCQTSL